MSDGNKLVKYAVALDVKDQMIGRLVVAIDILMQRAYEESSKRNRGIINFQISMRDSNKVCMEWEENE